MEDVLEKPVRTHALAELLHRFCRGAARTRAHDIDVLPPSALAAGQGIDGLVADVGIDLTVELAGEYIAGVTRAVQALRSGSAVSVQHDAHRLLGGARTLGLTQFESLWRHVETLSSSHTEIPDTTIAGLRRATTELERWIEAHHETHNA
jgi:hypothetical protein